MSHDQFDRWFDDSGWRWQWRWNQVARVPKAHASERRAASWLVIAYLKFQRNDGPFLRWSWIGATAHLGITEVKAIADEV